MKINGNDAARLVHLTPRERQVLSLLYGGFSNKRIARELAISLSTVKIHVSNIFGELNVSSRLEAVTVARRLALISEVSSEAADGEASTLGDDQAPSRTPATIFSSFDTSGTTSARPARCISPSRDIADSSRVTCSR